MHQREAARTRRKDNAATRAVDEEISAKPVAANLQSKGVKIMAEQARTRVAVNGYGVIGKRVVDAIALQDDM